MKKEVVQRLQAVNANNPVVINLRDMSIGDDDIEYIMQVIVEKMKACPYPLQLSLDQNELTDTGAIKLSACLSGFEGHIKQLSIEDNQLGEDGFAALFALEKKFPGIDFCLSGNKVTDVAVVENIKQHASKP